MATSLTWGWEKFISEYRSRHSFDPEADRSYPVREAMRLLFQGTAEIYGPGEDFGNNHHVFLKVGELEIRGVWAYALLHHGFFSKDEMIGTICSLDSGLSRVNTLYVATSTEIGLRLWFKKLAERAEANGDMISWHSEDSFIAMKTGGNIGPDRHFWISWDKDQESAWLRYESRKRAEFAWLDALVDFVTSSVADEPDLFWYVSRNGIYSNKTGVDEARIARFNEVLSKFGLVATATYLSRFECQIVVELSKKD